MTVFNTFWKVIKKYKGFIILFTVILVAFGGINTQTTNAPTTYADTKPDILIVNNDENKGLTKNLVTYLTKNSNVVKIKDDEDARNDALFYRDVNYIIYIPENYRSDILAGKTPEIEIKSAKDYTSSFTEMMLKRYLKTQSIYQKYYQDEDLLIDAINKNMANSPTITMTSKVDTNLTSKVSRYFNFSSYSIMAVIIFIVCTVLASFNETTLKKRTIISSMNYKKYNLNLLKASSIYGLIVWILYCLIALILFGKNILTITGLLFALNALVFTFSVLTLALLISSLTSNKNAINGIMNVLALGSAFLCGAFIPTEWLPETVVKISHIFPAYWFVNSNDIFASLETISIETLKPALINTGVILIFSIVFIILNNIITKKKESAF